jgi:uncharacterized protein DUF3854
MSAPICELPATGSSGLLNAKQLAQAAPADGFAIDRQQASPSRLHGDVSRPGISKEFLRRHDIRRVTDWQAEELLGFKPSSGGVWIPYPGPDSPKLFVNDLHFGRLRLDHFTSDAKYLSSRKSGAQVYVPQMRFSPDLLVIVEGEFKALSLAAAGIPAVGVGGITSAMSEGKLIPGLERLLFKYRPKIVYFLGDNDTCFIFAFSQEAVKLAQAVAKVLPDTEVRLPRIPLSEPKGIDDCRERLGNGFMEFWEGIAGSAVPVSAKLSASQLAVKLLTPELTFIASHESRRV